VGHHQEKTLSQKLIEQYEELILFLKENGALLNSIRPYYLLSYAEYLNFVKTDASKDHVALNCLKIPEARFSYLQNESWAQLTNQIIKVFYLSRVSLKPAKPSHLCAPALPEHYLLPSNLYSEYEVQLIHWLESFSNSIDSDRARIAALDADLKSGCYCILLIYAEDAILMKGHVVSQVVRKYIQSQKLDNLLQLKQRCVNEEDFRFNWNLILAGLTDMGIHVPIGVDDITQGGARDVLLLCLQLFFVLPYYQPAKDPISFECVLGECCSKIIELDNSTTKTVSYHVRYEGSADFQIEDFNPIKVEAKSSYKFKVRISNAQFNNV